MGELCFFKSVKYGVLPFNLYYYPMREVLFSLINGSFSETIALKEDSRIQKTDFIRSKVSPFLSNWKK